MEKLKITRDELDWSLIKVVNVQALFGGLNLADIVKFFFPNSKVLGRGTDQPLNGHNPGLDAIFPLKLYRKYLLYYKDNKPLPNVELIRKMLKEEKTEKDL